MESIVPRTWKQRRAANGSTFGSRCNNLPNSRGKMGTGWRQQFRFVCNAGGGKGSAGVNDALESEVFVERPRRWQPMKGETWIVYHARFEAEVSLKLNCLDGHEARGLWIQIADCYRSTELPTRCASTPRLLSNASRGFSVASAGIVRQRLDV